MEMSHILSRTERGALELQTRSGQATRRQRAILLLVNGERSAAEIVAEGQKIISVSYRSLKVYLAIALVYLLLTSAASYLMHRLERHIRAGGMVQ